MNPAIGGDPLARRRILHPVFHDASRRLELEYIACLLCSAEEFRPVVCSPDYETGIGGEFRAVRCERCGFVYTNPRPTVASIGQFYPADYAPHEGHAWNTGWRARLRRRLELAVLRQEFDYPSGSAGTVEPLLARLGRVLIRCRRRRSGWVPFRGQGDLLDFGCGGAVFLQQMRAYGWNVQGLDVSAAVATRVEAETGIPIHVGTLPHAAVLPESLDAITMWASLEHVHQPRETIGAAFRALRSCGLLVASVPNLASWPFQVFRQAWWGLELPRHLSHFTPQTLTQLLAGEGFRVLEIRHIGRDGWLRRSARRAAQLGIGPRWLRACQWKPLSLRITRWTEETDQAESILAVAEKP
jgi:2-polyprenyl-3-methyl-5-hydroxy-6-metoxy-1,4-benzoquinol methylase